MKYFILLWGLVACIQFFYDKSFLNWFISGGARTSESRGVAGVFSEPSFYGFACVMAIILVNDFKEQKNVWRIIAVFQLIFLAQSSVGIVYLCIYVFVYLLLKLVKVKTSRDIFRYLFVFFVSSIFVFLAIKFISNNMSNTRMYILLKGLFNDGFFSVVKYDQSVKNIN